jgi:TonB family protein
MKKCDRCGEAFEPSYRFCPVDGTPFVSHDTREIYLTLIEEASLLRRLATELRFVGIRLALAWPQLKQNPKAFTQAQLRETASQLQLLIVRPYARTAVATALMLVVAMIAGIAVLEKHGPKAANKSDDDEVLTQIGTLTFQKQTEQKSDSGVGDGDKGKVGFANGKGQGSNPRPARAQGGGGGGGDNPLAASQGRPPIPSVIPAPIPTTYARLPRSLPAAGLDIDPVLWKERDLPNYGDPRSKSTTPSNGPGTEGGIGISKGTGIGEGEDNGFGPGRKGNMGGGDNNPGHGGVGGSTGNSTNDNPERIYRSPEVTTRARVLFKPEPQYTEEARRAGITGTVILRVVFAKDGEVTNIRALQSLCCGLTEKAIAAARQIRFTPATRNGQPVPMYMQLEYNFNLY